MFRLDVKNDVNVNTKATFDRPASTTFDIKSSDVIFLNIDNSEPICFKMLEYTQMIVQS